jgi:hypothetical protein
MGKMEIVKANNLYTEIQVLIKQQAKLFLMLGKALKEIRDNELYKYLGEGGYDTFPQFLNNPEVGLSYSTAYLYIRIYEYYVLNLKLDEEQVIKTPLNKLMRMLPYLKTIENKEAVEFLEKSLELTNYDFNEELKDKQVQSDRPVTYRCVDCEKWRVEYHEKDICQCDDVFHLTNKDIVG